MSHLGSNRPPPHPQYTKQINEIDAERWRALISCDRIRIIGSGGLGTDHQHLGLEIWDKFPEVTADGTKTLTKFVDTIRGRK